MSTLSPSCLTNLIRLKSEQELSSSFPTDDVNTYINLINATERIARRLMRRQYFKYKTITNERHDGKGIGRFSTLHFPIISITALYDASDREFDSSSLMDTDDYEIQNTEGGIVRKYAGIFGDYQSNVRIDYIAGWSEFIIEPGNNTVEFNEGSSDITATLTTGSYNAATLATQIQTQLNASNGLLTYTITYNEISHKFTISANGSFSLLWNTGVLSTEELGMLLGFDGETDETGSASYTSDEPCLGVPEDLSDAIEELVRWRYSAIKENRIGKFAEARGEQSFSFDYAHIPEFIREILVTKRAWRMF